MKQLFKRYCNYLCQQGVSTNTRIAYQYRTRQFLDWLGLMSSDQSYITDKRMRPKMVEKYKRHLQLTKAPRSIQSAFSAIQSFDRFLHAESQTSEMKDSLIALR